MWSEFGTEVIITADNATVSISGWRRKQVLTFKRYVGKQALLAKTFGIPASDDEDGDEDEQQDNAADNGDQKDSGVCTITNNWRRNWKVETKAFNA